MTDSMITALLEHIFQNENMPTIGDSTGLRSSASDGYFYYGFHLANPREFDAETTYEGYARVAIPRSSSGFTIAGGKAFNYGSVQLSARTDSGAAQVITHFGIHTAISGYNNLFASGLLNTPISIVQGVIDPFGPGDLVLEINRV